MKTIPYGHQWIDRDDIRAVEVTLGSDWLTQGPKVGEFEQAICDYTGARYAVAVSSGTAALHLACLAAGIKQGDEVITTPLTFLATANSILYCGGKPVFADIQKDTINISPEEIKKKLTRRTKGIIPVHFAGHPCDLEEIADIARKHNLTVVEDAAHALGAEYKGIKIGSCKHSDMAVFSFHPIKTITTGEGGLITTNKKHLYTKLIALRTHGIYRDKGLVKKYGPWYYQMRDLGFNYRITDIQCALGISQLRKINKFIEARRRIVDAYNRKLSPLKGIALPIERRYVKSCWHIYYIRLNDATRRKSIFKEFLASGINCQVHYIPVYLHPYYRKIGYRRGICKAAEDFYRRSITLPLYPTLRQVEINKIIRTVLAVFGHN